MIYHNEYQNRRQAKRDIFHYIEVYYKRIRLHSTLNYKSPQNYENERRTSNLCVYFNGGTSIFVAFSDAVGYKVKEFICKVKEHNRGTPDPYKCSSVRFISNMNKIKLMQWS